MIIELNTVYHRTLIPTDAGYCSSWKYILHPSYSDTAKSSVSAFTLIQNELLDLFKYVEPVVENQKCYSHRILELFLRTCVEIEVNFKAILLANGYEKKNLKKNLNIVDYYKLEKTHKLSKYIVTLPLFDILNEEDNWYTRRPFSDWQYSESKLSWWKDYNDVKHSRHEHFKQANLGNLLTAVYGLLVILSAQFFDGRVFTPIAGDMRVRTDPNILLYKGIGDFFYITFPALDTWERKYSLNNDKPLSFIKHPDLKPTTK